MGTTLQVILTANTKGLRAGLVEASALTSKFAKGAFSASQKAEMAGKRLTKGVTLPMLGIGVAAGKAAVGFDDAMNQSLAIMGNVSAGMRDEMAKVARATAIDLGGSASEAAEGYFFLASAGFNAAQAVAAMPAVATFAKAGMFDMALATDLATDAQSALGLKSSDTAQNLANLTRVTDVMVKANTLSNASVQQFAEAMTNKAGPALKSVGKSIEEGTAVLAAFADQGIKGAAGGEALAIVTRDLQRAALKNADAFKEQGVSVFDANGEMRNYADIIGDVEQAVDGKSDAEKRAILTSLGFQDKSIANMLALLGTSDAIRDYEKALNDAGGTTDEVAAKQMESMREKLNVLRARVVDLGIGIGNYLVPKFIAVATVGAKVLEFFASLPGPLKAIAGGFATGLAVGGPLLLVFGKMGTQITRLGIYAKQTAAGTTLLGKALLFLSANPAVLFLAAFVAIAAGLVIAYKKSETFRNIVHAAMSVVGNIAQWVANLFSEKIPAAFQAVKDWVAANWPEIATLISGPFAPLVALATDAFGVRSAIVAAFGAIKRFAAGTVAAVVGFFAGLPGRLVSLGLAAGRGFVNGIRAGLSALGSALVSMIKGPLNAIIGGWNALGIPGFSLSIDLPGPVPDIGFSWPGIGLPDIPKLAAGGIVSRPTVALIGEAGPEAVVPLGRGGAFGGITVHIHVGNMVATREQLVRDVRDGLTRLNRRTGGSLFA